ncbi:heme o synthase [Sorangium cellulosum]|uniref:Protoheme IX farnesyltransferase n=1 Tax=Sorangium cellulosum TaxID=56 RepID=A0A150QIJ8_SORCE|nr:heme o synthase [Sorangium cellulosum]KYF67825.1 protoheme IX farnesyltransferase [Sorangium cellulosum]
MSAEQVTERAPVPYVRQAEPSASDGDGALHTSARPLLKVAADLVSLTKPRITRMVVATMLGGMWVASRYLRSGLAGEAAIERAAVPTTQLLLALLGTVLVVSGANVLNMYLERDTDVLMERTRNRPLPARRLAPEVALWFGIALSAASIPLLFVWVNAITAALAALALLSYVLVYTPLKRRTTLALPIGAIPGAIPPLLGWTSITGRIDVPGFLLFAVMFLWQIPHFLAIATFRRDEYRRAGLKVLPVEKGDRTTRLHMVGYLALLVLASVLLVPLGVGGPVYLGAAIVLGGAFFGVGAYGLRAGTGNRWARGVFVSSMVYLVLLFAAMMIGA